MKIFVLSIMQYSIVTSLSLDKSNKVLEGAALPNEKPDLMISFGFNGLKELLETIAKYQLHYPSRAYNTDQPQRKHHRIALSKKIRIHLKTPVRLAKQNTKIYPTNNREQKEPVHPVLEETY